MLTRRSFIQALISVPVAFAVPPARARSVTALSYVHIDAVLTKISTDYMKVVSVDLSSRVFPLTPADAYRVSTCQPACHPDAEPITVTLTGEWDDFPDDDVAP